MPARILSVMDSSCAPLLPPARAQRHIHQPGRIFQYVSDDPLRFAALFGQLDNPMPIAPLFLLVQALLSTYYSAYCTTNYPLRPVPTTCGIQAFAVFEHSRQNPIVSPDPRLQSRRLYDNSVGLDVEQCPSIRISHPPFTLPQHIRNSLLKYLRGRIQHPYGHSVSVWKLPVNTHADTL